MFEKMKKYTERKIIKKHTAVESVVFIVPFSDTDPLGEDPSSDPSLTGDGGCGGCGGAT